MLGASSDDGWHSNRQTMLPQQVPCSGAEAPDMSKQERFLQDRQASLTQQLQMVVGLPTIHLENIA